MYGGQCGANRQAYQSVGEQSDTAYQAESILERAASAKKELVRIEGATHVSLYDKDADKAVEKLAVFFKENL